MANVYGNIGDQPVELNNAASEATLNALLEVAKAQFNSQTKGKDAKAQRDLEKKLRDLAAATVSTTATVKTEEQIRNKSIRAIREETEARRQSALTTENLKKVATTATNELTHMANSIARMGDSISSATQVMTSLVKQIPIVGGALGGFADAVASAIEGTQKSFMAASSVGANFGASINSMIKSASESGLTIDQFTSIIAKNGESLAMLGTSTADGAKRLSQLGATIRNSGLQDELANLGFNSQEINDSMASYVGLLGKTNRLTGLSNQQLINHTVDYLKNLDAISKITGENRKAIEDRMAAEKNDAQIMVTMRKLGVESQKELRTAMALLPEEHKRGFKDILATGTATTEEAKNLFNFMPELAQSAQRMNRQIMETNSLVVGSGAKVYDLYQKEATALADSELGQQLSKFMPDLNGFMTAVYQTASREGKTHAEAMAEVEEAAKKQASSFGEMNPAQLVKTQQEIAESSNEMTRTFLRLSGTLLSVLEGFQNGIQSAVGMLDDLSDWVDKAWKKIKEWIEIFDTSGIGGIFGKLTSAIFDGMKDGVNFLIDKAIEIGEKIGTGLINTMPKWMKSMFGIEEKNDTRSVLEKERDDLVTLLTTARQNVAAQGVEDEEQTQMMVKLENQIKDLNNQIKTGGTASDAQPRSSIDANGGVSRGVDTQTNAVNGLTSSLEKQVDANAEWAKSGQVQWAADDRRRKEQAERDRKHIEATEANTKATKDLSKETKSASSCDLDYSSPQALFNSFAKIMVGGKPGATDMISGASVATTTGGAEMYSSVGPSGTVMPTRGRVSDEFGMRDHPVYGSRGMHKGIDIAATKGTDVLAPEGGTVRLKTEIDKATGKMKGYGKYIEILNDQGEVIHRLAHLSEKIVKEGERVVAGQVIGKVGNTGTSTGAHLHWETLKSGKQYDPRMFMANASGARQAGSTQPRTPSAQTRTITPTAAAATAAITQESAANGTTPVQTESAGRTTTSQAGPGAPGAAAPTTISSLVDQLETLNSSIGQLVAYSEVSLRLTEKHINVTKSLSNDQFIST